MIIMILAIVATIAIYGLICYYIGFNGWVWWKSTPYPRVKKTFVALFVLLSLSVFAGQLLPVYVFKVVSGLWMVVVGYSLLILPLANLYVRVRGRQSIRVVGRVVLLFYLGVISFGSYFAWSPVVRQASVTIDKQAGESSELKILMASDIHAGVIVGKSHLERLVAIAEQEQPDLILIPGDMIDDYIEPYLDQNMGEVLDQLQAPLGVYAVLGNHDYYGNDDEKIVEEMERIGITVLTDEWVEVEDFVLVGRKDPTDSSRAKLESYLQGVDPRKPVIMMDHQPIDFDEAAKAEVDLMLSGHTHKGQMYPASIITDLIYENDYGYERFGSLHSIVSSGFGSWGPPIRIGSRAEVWTINVTFK